MQDAGMALDMVMANEVVHIAMQMGPSRHGERELHWHIPEVEAASSSSSYPRLVEVLASAKGAWLERGSGPHADHARQWRESCVRVCYRISSR